MSDSKLPKTHQLGLIGGGNMAFALASGLVAKGFAAGDICVADPLPARCQKMADIGVSVMADSALVAAAAEHLVLAVKPQVMGDVLAAIAVAVSPGQMVLSIAAGISIAQIKASLGPELPIVRAMPNTPVLVGAGATALYGENISAQQRVFATDIMSAVGLARWVDSEDHLDAITAVSGSGPAYFLMLMEEMTRIGTYLGLSQVLSEAMVKQTALGTAQLALESGQSLTQLRANVTSSGGTTEAAMNVLYEQNVPGLLEDAIVAARDRAASLAEEHTK